MLDYERSRRPDPDPDGIHYIMSESAEYDLRVAVFALHALATLCIPSPTDDGPDINPRAIGSLFYVCADYLNGIVNEVELRTPTPH